FLLLPDGPPVGEARGFTRDRRLRISVGRDGTGRDGYGGVPMLYGGSPSLVPAGQVWDIALTCELAVTVSPLPTLALALILTLRLNIGLHRLIFSPVDELVAGVAVMLILDPHASPDQLLSVSLGAAPL